MESLFSPPAFPGMFRCVGLIKAQYFPGKMNFSKGIVVTEDGKSYPACLTGKMSRWLQLNQLELQHQKVWSVWVRMSKKEPFLFFQLICIWPSDKVHTNNIDCFSIRGRVIFQKPGEIKVSISRNSEPPAGKERQVSWRSFTLTINGSIPPRSVGQFWEFQCCRNAHSLVMEKGKFIKEVPIEIPKKSQGFKKNQKLILPSKEVKKQGLMSDPGGDFRDTKLHTPRKIEKPIIKNKKFVKK